MTVPDSAARRRWSRSSCYRCRALLDGGGAPRRRKLGAHGARSRSRRRLAAYLAAAVHARFQSSRRAHLAPRHVRCQHRSSRAWQPDLAYLCRTAASPNGATTEKKCEERQRDSAYRTKRLCMQSLHLLNGSPTHGALKLACNCHYPSTQLLQV